MDVETISFTRRRLPHWQVCGRSYFVTFRLRGSLPIELVLSLKKEREELQKRAAEEDEIIEFQRYEFKKIEAVLDSVNNDVNGFLGREDIAPMLMDSFENLEKIYCWRFPSYVIMPNHVHCLCVADKTGKNAGLVEVLSLFKQFTGKRINNVLDRKGKRVWVDENFDHWCRSSDKEESVKRYIADNPVKAGLVKQSEEWKWQK